MINYLIDLIHVIFVLMPIGIFFIPKKYFWFTKIIILFLLLTPIHWILFDNNCILSLFSKKTGGLKNSKYGSPFTEKYLGWLFLPILDFFKMERNKNNFSKLVNIQWMIKYLIIYYYLFHYIKCDKF